MLKQYVRDYRNRRVGVMVGMKDDNNTMLVGFSRCAPSDKFCPVFGTHVAEDRAKKWLDREFGPQDFLDRVPESMYKDLREFVRRCEKYFKNTTAATYLDDMR